MKTLRLVMVGILCLGVGMLTACSHFKKPVAKKTPGMTATQAAGLGVEEDGFASEGSPNRLKAPYNQTYHFGLNQYDVQSEDTESINAQAEYLIAHPNAKVRLEGNCDERGSREYNIALGWKRAKAVAEVLKQQGVSSSQIATVSYGKEKLVAFGHDEEAHRLNRRVDFIYECK